MTYNYTVIFEEEPEGGYHVYCPALRGCHTQGETHEEALRNIREAIELYIESLRDHGEPILREDGIVESVPVAV
jgi:predicted RNase H-like HicB family nuclease